MNDFGTYQTAMGVGRCGQTSSPCRPAAYVCLTGKSERSNNVLRPVELAGVPRLHCCEGFPAAPHSWPQCPAPCSTGGTGDLVHAHIFLGHLAVASCRRKNKDFGGTRERRCVMTKKQLAALRRILDREKAAYQVRSGRPAPGQHPSEDKYAIADGTICVLMDGPEAALPVGEQADTFARSDH